MSISINEFKRMIKNFPDGIYVVKNLGTFYYDKGYLHRTDGPAIEYLNGNKHWFLNGKRHREDGPAIEYANGTKYWFINDQCHRANGPAIESYNGNNKWFMNDREVPEEYIYLLKNNLEAYA